MSVILHCLGICKLVQKPVHGFSVRKHTFRNSQKHIVFLAAGLPKIKTLGVSARYVYQEHGILLLSFLQHKYPFPPCMPWVSGIPACCIANTEEYTKQPVFRQFTFGHLEFQPCFNLLSFHLFPLFLCHAFGFQLMLSSIVPFNGKRPQHFLPEPFIHLSLILNLLNPSQP